MPVILLPPVPFMDIATPLLLYALYALCICVNYYMWTMYIIYCIYIYVYVCMCASYIRIMSPRAGPRYYYLGVTCREFRPVKIVVGKFKLLYGIIISRTKYRKIYAI